MTAKEYRIIRESILEAANRKSLRDITRFNLVIDLAQQMGIEVKYYMTSGSTPTQFNFIFKNRLEIYVYDREQREYKLYLDSREEVQKQNET